MITRLDLDPCKVKQRDWADREEMNDGNVEKIEDEEEVMRD